MDFGHHLCCYGVPALYVALSLLSCMFLGHVAAATAEGGSTDSAAPAVAAAAPEVQENGAPVKRSKRQRVEVDYAAMAAKEDAEREAALKEEAEREAAGAAGAV